MTQLHTISKNNTAIIHSNGHPEAVILHQTTILRLNNDSTISLDTGGWLTPTTITRINQAANQWGLGFTASRKGGEFSVTTSEGLRITSGDGRTIRFRA